MDESYFGGRRKVKRGRGIILGLTWMKSCPMCLVESFKIIDSLVMS
jgi:hypothetical protein